MCPAVLDLNILEAEKPSTLVPMLWSSPASWQWHFNAPNVSNLALSNGSLNNSETERLKAEQAGPVLWDWGGPSCCSVGGFAGWLLGRAVKALSREDGVLGTLDLECWVPFRGPVLGPSLPEVC